MAVKGSLFLLFGQPFFDKHHDSIENSAAKMYS